MQNLEPAYGHISHNEFGTRCYDLYANEMNFAKLTNQRAYIHESASGAANEARRIRQRPSIKSMHRGNHHYPIVFIL